MNLEIDPDELDDFSPERIAQELFTKEPKTVCSIQLISEQQNTDASYIFEILIIILMEGLEILTGDLSKTNINLLTSDYINALDPWFKSLGFQIKVNTFPKENKQNYSKYYCKIIIKDKLHEIFFEMKNILKNYHFYLNGECLQENRKKTTLNELYAVFINNDTTFKIEFDFYYPNSETNKII